MEFDSVNFTPAAELPASFAVSLAVGLLVGLERQRAIAAKEGSAVLPGGVRTFPLVALGGSVATLLGGGEPWLVIGALVALVLLLVAHRNGLAPDKREEGLTTELAAVFTFLLGALATDEHSSEHLGLPGAAPRLLLCAALGVIATLLLSVKPKLHDVVRRISDEDLLATVQILVLAVIALPLLPDKAYGPFQAINPQTIGRMILFVGFVSFIGYAASRLLGNRRGLAVAGVVGGLVSSTAVTFAMSRRAHGDERIRASCTLAVVTASSMMFARVLVAVLVVNASLLPALAPSLGAMLVAGVVHAALLWRTSRTEQQNVGEVELKNPFELKSAIVFGLLFAGVTFAAKAVRATLGDTFLPLAGLVAGTTDVDAITLSTAGLARESLSPTIAGATIVAACFANTVVKAGIAFIVGGRKFGARFAIVALTMGVAGGVALAIQFLAE